MEELGQQSMMEKPPPRSLIVPKGHDSWWGVDPSTRGVSLGWRTPDGGRGVLTQATSGAGLERLHRSFTAGRMAAIEALAYCTPGIVVVEQPSGKQVNNELVMAVGAICAGLVSALPSARYEMIVPSWWKARACGNGGIKKPKPGHGEYQVLVWARLNGYEGSSWDEADAEGMAEAAHREWALVER